MKLIDVDLNKGARGKYIYIIDFFVYIQKINNPPDGYEIDINNIELLYNLVNNLF